jgi:signal transduction histidine kinase/ligand-binding sensor domain-containing protein
MRRPIGWRAVALVVGLAATSARAQPARFDRLTLEHGLSQSTVMVTYQDRRGFLWFGTEDGLNRYDGYEFVVHRHDPADPRSLSDNYVITLHETPEGALWVGTSDGGLNRMDPATGRFRAFRHDPAVPASLAHDRVTALAAAPGGRLWVGTRGGGLDLFDPRTGRARHFRHDSTDARSLPDDDVWTLLVDRRGRLWIGTRGGGLARLDPSETPGQAPGARGFVRYRHDPTDARSLPGDDILGLHEDRDGTVWVAVLGGGLARFDPVTDRFDTFRHDPADPNSLTSDAVVSVWRDARGDVWAGTWGDGLNRLDPRTGRVDRYRHDERDPQSLSDDYARSLYESPDGSGLLWIGTSSGGVSVFNPARERFHHLRHDPADPASLITDYVRAFAEGPDGALWVATRDGLSRRGRDGRFTPYVHDPARPSSLANSYVRALLTDRRGTLWVGTAGGLDRFDARTGTFAHFPHETGAGGDPNANRVYVVVEDAEGLLWVGTRFGLYAFDPAQGRYVRRLTHDPADEATLPNDEVISLTLAPDGALWAGTVAGLGRVDRRSGRVARYVHDAEDTASLSNDRVFSIHVAADRTVWVGTNNGLNRLLDARRGRFRRYTTRDGLPNDLVYGVLEDGTGALWLSTNLGLARFDPRRGTFRGYDASAGLQSNEFNQGAYYRARNGDLLFGGIGGYNRFDPEAIRPNPHVPPVVLTRFRVFDAAVTPRRGEDGAIRLDHAQNFFSFEFAALDFANPERNQYAYMLEGFDTEWHHAGTRRYVSYTNLDGGRYVFRVRGSNNDGVWNEAGLALPLVVVPPYWDTWWFRVVLALTVLALGFGGAWAWQRQKLRRSELRRAELAEAQRRLSEGREQERLHLARELHDGPVQDLYSAQLHLAMASEALSANGTLKPAQETIQRVSQSLRAICGALRPPALAPFGLAAALRSLAEHHRNAHPGLVVELDLTNDGQRVPADVRLALFRIAQEALANTAKHAGARTVRLTFTLDAEEAVLEVCDDGRGFAVPSRWIEGARAGRFGLLGMGERAEAIGGRLAVHSAVGEGTTLRVVVPVHQPAEPAPAAPVRPPQPEVPA